MIVNAWHGVHGLTSYPPNYLEQGELRISYNLPQVMECYLAYFPSSS